MLWRMLGSSAKQRSVGKRSAQCIVGRSLAISSMLIRPLDCKLMIPDSHETACCRQLWDWLASGAYPPVHADVLRFQLLTGARCGEAAGILAEEIDRDAWTWTLPAERSKNSRPRTTPLVGMAREIIERRLPKSGPVFPSDAGT